jgi:septum formation protein
LGIHLTVVAVEADEVRRAAEDPDTYLDRVTRDKLARVAADTRALGTSVLLVADTIVLLDRDILGKPANAEEAMAMLMRLSGRAHEVQTRFLIGPSPTGPTQRGSAVGIVNPAAAPLHAETVTTKVQFRRLDADEIRRYAASGEGMDKAGGYAVQGVGSFAVQRIEGSYANVVGLPVCEVVVALRRLGLLPAFP